MAIFRVAAHQKRAALTIGAIAGLGEVVGAIKHHAADISQRTGDNHSQNKTTKFHGDERPFSTIVGRFDPIAGHPAGVYSF